MLAHTLKITLAVLCSLAALTSITLLLSQADTTHVTSTQQDTPQVIGTVPFTSNGKGWRATAGHLREHL